MLAIKLTLYRTSGDTAIVRALTEAAQRGKQVAVLVELKARFDEANNITWARTLEDYRRARGVRARPGSRRTRRRRSSCGAKPDGIRRYVHIGTGNYNSKTARLYTDVGAVHLQPVDRRRRERPVQLAHRLLAAAAVPQAARRAGEHARALPRADRPRSGARARGAAGAHHREDERARRPGDHRRAVRASQAGVEIDLIVRGICCLRPGVPGRERPHSRDQHRRPVPRALARLLLRERRRRRVLHRLGRLDAAQLRSPRRGGRAGRGRRRCTSGCAALLETCLDDNRQAWELDADGRYVQRKPRGEPSASTHVRLLARFVGPIRRSALADDRRRATSDVAAAASDAATDRAVGRRAHSSSAPHVVSRRAPSRRAPRSRPARRRPSPAAATSGCAPHSSRRSDWRPRSATA